MKYVLSKPISIHELGQRANQEDNFYPPIESLTDGQRFFILCDGMGGHESGEVASSTVCEYMGGYLNEHLSAGERFTDQMFENALSAAYDGLDSKDKPDAVKKMGTTMTFLMFHDAGVTAAHIGDSRIYQFRPGVAEPLFKSRDHSLVNDLIMLGELTEEEARTSMNKNVITRAMQPGQENRARADINLLTDIKPGDWFYMCSDGMLEDMDDAELGGLLTDTSMTDNEKKEQLISRTISNRDNHTAFIIHVQDVIEETIEVEVTDFNAEPQPEPKFADVGNIAVMTKKPSKKSEPARKSSKPVLPLWFYYVTAALVGVIAFLFISKTITFPTKPSGGQIVTPAGKPGKKGRMQRSKDVTITSLSMSSPSLTLEAGNSYDLNISFEPSDATVKNVTWVSSDDKVATVNNGHVTAIKAGSALIKAICDGKEASCNVTVNERTGEGLFQIRPAIPVTPVETTPLGGEDAASQGANNF